MSAQQCDAKQLRQLEEDAEPVGNVPEVCWSICLLSLLPFAATFTALWRLRVKLKILRKSFGFSVMSIL